MAMTTMLLALAGPLLAAVASSTAVHGAGEDAVEVLRVHDDAVKGRRPAILLLHHNLDGVDHYIKTTARRLAERGYLVIAPTLASGKDFGGVTDAQKLDREQHARFGRLVAQRARESLKILAADPLAKAAPPAVVGYCHLGAPAAMNLVRQGSEIGSVVLLWGGVDPRDISTMWARRRPKAKILALLGGSDVETNPYLASFSEEMRLGQADWRLVLYGKAEHGFTLPGPHAGDRGKYDPEADRLSWDEMTAFLDEHAGFPKRR